MAGIGNRVAQLFERWARGVIRHPWIVLTIAACLIAGFASRIPLITVDTSTEGFLHPTDPALVAYDAFRAEFGRDDLILLGVETEDPFTFEALERLRAVHDDLVDSAPYVYEITSLLNARSTRGSADELLVEDLVEEWPETAEQLEALRERVAATPLYENSLISRDGRITTILIELETFIQDGVGEDGTPLQRYLSGSEQREVVQAVEAVIARHQAADFTIHAVGTVWMADRLAYRMFQDLPKLVRRGFLLMVAILFILFGSIRAVLLPLLVIVSTLLVTFGSLPLFGMPYQLPTQVIALSLLAVGVGDSIHILATYYHYRREGRDNEDAIAEAFAHAGPAILLTSLTTAGAMLSFISAEIAPIANIGVLLPFGVMSAFLITTSVLPALLAVLPEPKRLPKQKPFRFIERGITRTGLWAADHPKVTLGTAGALFCIALLGAMQVKFAHNPMLWFPPGDVFRESTLEMNDELEGVVTLEMLFTSNEDDGIKEPEFLAALEDLARSNDKPSQDPDAIPIGKTISIADLLKETHRALNENNEAFYRLPETRELVAQELLLFELSGSNDLEDLANYKYRTARMTIRVPWVDATRYSGLTDGLIASYRERVGEMAEVELTGRVPVLSRTMTATIQSMGASYVIAFAVVTPLMILFLANVRMGLISMIPNLLPITVALGLMGFLGLPLDLFSLLTGSITLGIAVDDTIHFMHGVRRELRATGDTRLAIERTLTVTGQALFSTTLILCCLFGLYATAYMRNLVNFGFVTAFALAVALLADIIVAPALVSLMGANAVGKAPANTA